MSGCKTGGFQSLYMKTKNIIIPFDLLLNTLKLLCYFDASSYDSSIQHEYYDVVRAISNKLQKMELRRAYSNIISAKDEEDRLFAQMNYLNKRLEYRRDLST
jgi:hypothetical protein